MLRIYFILIIISALCIGCSNSNQVNDQTNGKNERVISEAFHVEGPTWSPNGRYLMYYKQSETFVDSEGNVKNGGESQLFMIDLTGHHERQILTPLEGSDPAWSPLLH